MANVTITNLPSVTGLSGSEPLLGVQSGTSVQITTGQIVSLATGGGGISPLSVIGGGTGDTTLTAYGLLYGNGTAPIGSISPPAGTNYILVGSSGSAPTWQPTIPVTAGVDSINTGTTGLLVGNTSGQSPIGNTDVSGVVTLSGVLNAVNGGTGQSSYTVGDLLFASSTTALSKLADVATGSVLISGGVGVAPSYSSSPTISGTTTSSFFIANGTITGALSAGAYSYGTLSYTDTNIFASYQTSANSYAQVILANNNSGTAASTDFIVGNNNTTSSTYFGDFGMNSSGFTGTGSFNGANNVFLTSTTADLAIGTTTANAIRFVVNGATTDTITLPSTGNLFQADFTNATLTSRLAFQTSTSNSTTGIYALPNGTATAASWQATNAADPTNASKVLIATNGTTDVQLVSGRNGTGTYLPLSFFTNNSGQFVINTSGAWGIGPVATASYGTSGQAYISGGNAAQPTWGTLQVGGGGTGATTFTANGVVYGNATSALGVTAAGTTGQVLIGNTGGAPTWSSTIPTTAGVTSISFGTTGLTPNSATTGAVTVAGTLVVANGGTGQSSNLTQYGVIYGSTTTAMASTTAGTTGQPLLSNTTSGPAFGNLNIGTANTNVTGTLTVTNGGTGAATFTSNGVLYGNATSAIQVTAQGAANSILTANAGAPSFSASPTIGTSVTVPLVIGGTAASSILTLESTSGAGTTDSIQFLTASQSEAARYDTTGAYFFKRVANALNATATLTVAQLRGGIITSTTASAYTFTIPTGTVLDTAGTGLAATTLPTNATIQFTIKNTGATNAITVAVATGVTNGGVAADLTIAASGTATYQLTKTGTNTFVLYKQ